MTADEVAVGGVAQAACRVGIADHVAGGCRFYVLVGDIAVACSADRVAGDDRVVDRRGGIAQAPGPQAAAQHSP